MEPTGGRESALMAQSGIVREAGPGFRKRSTGLRVERLRNRGACRRALQKTENNPMQSKNGRLATLLRRPGPGLHGPRPAAHTPLGRGAAPHLGHGAP